LRTRRPGASKPRTAARAAALAIDDPIFAAFDAAKRRVRSMQVRYAKETGPLRQALQEICAAVVLAAPYNDLNTD
jgi:hypothetical protein